VTAWCSPFNELRQSNMCHITMRVECWIKCWQQVNWASATNWLRVDVFKRRLVNWVLFSNVDTYRERRELFSKRNGRLQGDKISQYFIRFLTVTVGTPCQVSRFVLFWLKSLVNIIYCRLAAEWRYIVLQYLLNIWESRSSVCDKREPMGRQRPEKISGVAMALRAPVHRYMR